MRRRRAERLGIAGLAAIVLAGTAACSFGGGSADPLTVFGPWRGTTAESFRAVLDRFQAESGIEVRYTGTASFSEALSDRILEGNPPDVAIFPQPGLLDELAERGYVRPLPSDVRTAALDGYVPAVAEVMGARGGTGGVVVRVSVKSLVWYRPDTFESQGYSVPASWDEVAELSVQAAADGLAPWCLGVAAGDASGWPATDWVEDIILRLSGPEIYDEWVEGEVPFTDSAIVGAFREFDRIALSSLGPIGGRRAAANTPTTAGQGPMLELVPRCLMYRQASFQLANLPEGVEVGRDVDVFVLPGLDASEQAPLLVGGDLAASLTDRPEAAELLRFLASPRAGEAWAARGDFISPYTGFDPDEYERDFDARMAELLRGAEVVRFDGSDLMQPEVGSRSFLDAMMVLVATGRVDQAITTAQSGYEE